MNTSIPFPEFTRRASANIAVGSTREPHHTTHTIQMDFGKKKIRIKIFKGQMAPPNISIF